MSFFRRMFGGPTENDDRPSTPTPPESNAAVNVNDTQEAAEQTAPSQEAFLNDGATRPLSEETLYNYMGEGHLVFGQSSDVGMVRTNNQDAAHSFFTISHSVDERPDFGFFIVADGMGGHHDGEKASAIAARTVATQIMSTIYQPILLGKENDEPISDALAAAVQKANSDVIAKVPDGGTTVTTVVLINDLAHIAHVGDSRIYLVTANGIERLTRDHSLVQRLIELDQLTPEEANDHPQKNVLYRALGQSDLIDVDILTRRLPPKSAVLLCSDGLWNLVEDHEIADTVKGSPTPQDACNRLIALANKRGGNDNITVIVLKLPG